MISKTSFEAVSEREDLLLEEVRELIEEYNKKQSELSEELLSREAADVLYVSIGNMLALNKEGISAMNQVAIKNNNKTDLAILFHLKISTHLILLKPYEFFENSSELSFNFIFFL